MSAVTLHILQPVDVLPIIRIVFCKTLDDKLLFFQILTMYGLECWSAFDYAVPESRSVLFDDRFWCAMQFYIVAAFFLGNG